MPINNLKRFFTYKKLNSIFLKFDHFLIKMSKIINQIGLIIPAEKRDSKT